MYFLTHSHIHCLNYWWIWKYSFHCHSATCTTLNVSQLFDVYQLYQTNSKLELVILHFNILKCLSDRIDAGTRHFRCLFFVQQRSEAAVNKRMSSTLCRFVEVFHGRLKKKRFRKWQGCRCCLFLRQGQYKGEKETFRPDHTTIKTLIVGSSRDETRKKFIISCSYPLCKLVDEMERKPRQSLVYSVPTGLGELFLSVHWNLFQQMREESVKLQRSQLWPHSSSYKHIL